MKFISFVGTAGAMPEAALATMNDAWPAFEEQMDALKLWRLGRELDLPENGIATVQVREAATIVTDGPFAETKEFVAGFSLMECDDLAAAVEIETKNPVALFHPLEVRPFHGEPDLGAGAAAFGAFDDSAGTPYLLATWVTDTVADHPGDPQQTAAYAAWRQAQAADDCFVLGGELQSPDSATTVRVKHSRPELTAGSFLPAGAFISGIDVIRSGSLAQATARAASHPAAAVHAIEVRPFYTGSATDPDAES